MSQYTVVTDSSLLYKPNGESYTSIHTQLSAPTKYQYQRNNTSPTEDYNSTSSVYTAPKPGVSTPSLSQECLHRTQA